MGQKAYMYVLATSSGILLRARCVRLPGTTVDAAPLCSQVRPRHELSGALTERQARQDDLGKVPPVTAAGEQDPGYVHLDRRHGRARQGEGPHNHLRTQDSER